MPAHYRNRKKTLLSNWLDIQSDELKGFALATAALYFIIASNVLFSNYAETAFLKRFGVDSLPNVILANTILAIIMMSLVSRLLQRFPGQTVLRWALILCTLSVFLARIIIPLEIKFLYPVVYVMKTQYEILLTFLFWNLANHIFSARQSKRLFPLMVSGGILGGLCGSFSTLGLAHLGAVDNALWVYIAGTLTAVFLLSHLVSATEHQDVKENSAPKRKTRSLLFAELREILPMMGKLKLVRWLVLLTLIPNVIPPLLDYQVSFAIDMTYTDESSMLSFFSFYRAAQLMLALILSLFASRIYNRFGLSGGLLIHPFNHLLLFFIFMLQFDIFTVVYAGISVSVIRQAIQTPGRQALNGVLPNEQRVILIPFLKGTVVRIGALTGATFVVLCQGAYFAICSFPLHPQNLAPLGIAFTFLWVLVALQIKKHYPELVLETLGWRGPERGNVDISDETMSRVREQISIIKLRLTQAIAVKNKFGGELSEKLIQRLTELAHSYAFDVVKVLESNDTSGRLSTVRSELEGNDARRSANAIEVLEHILPRELTRGLVLGLEKNLRGGRYYRGQLLNDLASDEDKLVRELTRQITGTLDS